MSGTILRQVLAIISAILVGGGYIPYAVDIIKRKARPARSTRIMFALLLIVALVQQREVGSGLALALTIGETIGTLGILGLALKYGIGGLKRLDVVCYGLLLLDLIVWLTSHSPTLALHLTILADTIAFWPTLHKTWHNPQSETPLFYMTAVIAPMLSLLAQVHLTYSIMLFPLYISVANGIEVLLIYRKAGSLRYHE